jgi:probable F420-dependent oxidoreductase
VLFSFMAALTTVIEFFPGVIILPQRQTALVAKQAACLDVLSRGRLRLGIGIGWNHVEYEALGQDFRRRGQRMEEQIALLRTLWTAPLVTFHGAWHTVSDAGLNPLPVQRPIPIWFGGDAEAALRRMAYLGDGWLTTARSPQEATAALDMLRKFLREAHRDPSAFGIEAQVSYGDGGPREWESLSRAWQAAGITRLSLNTMEAGLGTPAKHLSAMRDFAQAMGISRSG